MPTTPVFPPDIVNDPIAFGYSMFTDMASRRKEWKVSEYDGTENTTDDISPMVRAVVTAPFTVDVTVLCPQIDRDMGLAAAQVLGILQPDFITFMADAHVTPQPINPSTGEKWKPGEMQAACDVEGACAVGVLDDCLSFNTVWRSGRVRMESLIYTVTKGLGVGASSMVWSGTHVPDLFDTASESEGEVSGLVVDHLLRAMEMPNLAAATGAALGLGTENILRRTVMGTLRAMSELGYACLAVTDDDDLNEMLRQVGEPVA